MDNRDTGAVVVIGSLAPVCTLKHNTRKANAPYPREGRKERQRKEEEKECVNFCDSFGSEVQTCKPGSKRMEKP
jgi:hypothetical protein